MTQLVPTATGVLFRNPAPHLRSVHAYFPSVVVLADGTLLASVALGEAFEATNLRTHLFRSVDGGATWANEGPVPDGTAPGKLCSNCARLTALPDGSVAVFLIRHDRTDHPDEGLTSHETLGFVPTDLLILRSHDGGRSWRGPHPIIPSLAGPAFEMCAPITPLRDGRWVIPTQTWPGWEGECPSGIRMVGLVSHDQGDSWPEHLDVMRDPEGRVYFWESKIVELVDGRLLATAWVYDDVAKRDRPNHFVVSETGGSTWSAPASTGLLGQTLTPLVLEDGRILCVYRRMDQSGLWAALARVDGARWVTESQWPLWGNAAHGLTATTADMAHNFNVLRFGAPSLVRLGDGSVFVAFWCYEDCVSNIRWFRLRPEAS